MNAISVHYLSPTNTRGSRFVATHPYHGKHIMSYDYSLCATANHLKAVRELCAKYNLEADKFNSFGYLKKGVVVYTSSDSQIVLTEDKTRLDAKEQFIAA